ncbi:M48 family metallopeptidase [Aurantiacibacter marinus]|uniref:M48 family metallopeptidase n=1 Tax=Aurantiacibacter marinus TaxID=874156 RepID=UPI00069BB39E|nr:M48 family metallopeptidase [Aurantiacibacter marinus]
MKSFRTFALSALLGGALVAAPAHARQDAAQDNQAQWAALAREDVRLAGIADTLLRANAELCRSTMPVTGMILHSADQYRAGLAEARFANGPLAVSSLVPISPAARSGLLPNDAILAIGGRSIATIAPPEDGNLREAAFDLLASQPADRPINILIARGGAQMELAVSAPAGCRTLVEILVGDGPRARSDGRVIQVQYGFAGELTDQQMAVVIAHELAHTVLEHRRRKEEAGIDNGLFAELGRNQRVNRAAEVEADRLSIHLLANAGYDPTTVPEFWRSEIGRGLGGILTSFVYPSQEARAQIVEEEMVRYLPQRRGPSWPGHLLGLRDRNFRAD